MNVMIVLYSVITRSFCVCVNIMCYAHRRQRTLGFVSCVQMPLNGSWLVRRTNTHFTAQNWVKEFACDERITGRLAIIFRFGFEIQQTQDYEFRDLGTRKILRRWCWGHNIELQCHQTRLVCCCGCVLGQKVFHVDFPSWGIRVVGTIHENVQPRP